MMRLTNAVAVATFLAVALPPAAGLAHNADSYYDLHWMTLPSQAGVAVDTDVALNWGFSPTFEEEAQPDAADAADAWNTHAGRVRFRQGANVTSDPGIGPCPTSSILGDDVNVIRSGEIDGPALDSDEGEGGILAVTALCATPLGGVAYHFTITYDVSEPWHFGAGPIDAGTFDLQGVLAHEFGHATGWGRHFENDTGTECLATGRHTMCSTVSPGLLDARTLEEHDIDTWQDAY